MDRDLVQKLNKLNQKFYEALSEQFSSSRSYFWSGWYKCWDYAANKIKIESVLDIGCGDGRFAAFLEERNYHGNYAGYDFSNKLLEIARNRKINGVHFIELDILNEEINAKQSDLVVCFGVMHHIPDYNNRLEFIRKLANLIRPGGFLILSFWQFLKLPEYSAKIIDWKQIGIDVSELESNDYLLGWNKGNTFRYCHYFDNNEIDSLIKESGLKLEIKVAGQKKNDETNTYVVLSSSDSTN